MGAQRGFYLTGNKWQCFADFISGNLPDSFEISPETHPVSLHIGIPKFAHPITNKTVAFTQINYHYFAMILEICPSKW
jgi:hypothetical protein